MTELQSEQSFGREATEKNLGYIPAVVDLPKDEPQGDISIEHSELRDAAKEITEGRDKERVEREGRSFDSTVEVRDSSGRKLPENQTLTAEEASHLVTGARVQEETTTDLNEQTELARLIDEARAGVTTEQLGVPEPQPLVEQQPRPEVAPHIAQNENEAIARKLQESPELLQAVQNVVWQEQQKSAQAAQAASNAAITAADSALIGLATAYPELQGLNAAQFPTALAVIAKSSPQRAQNIIDHIGLIDNTLRRGNEARQAEAQRMGAAYQQWQQQQQVQWQQTAQAHDQAFDKWAEQQGATRADREAMIPEVMSMLRESGMSDQDIAHQYQNGPMRSLQGQQILWMAAKYRMSQRGAKAKLSRPVPAVQRPGSPLERASDQDYAMRNLERPGQDLTPKQAAALVTARRNARR
jgi:hypothetical protein